MQPSPCEELITHRTLLRKVPMQEEQNTLPPGYIDLGYVAMHAAKLRKYTADIHRFQAYLGLVLELERTEPNTKESNAVFSKAGDIDLLALTCRELGDAVNASVKALEAEPHHPALT